jgi:tRNA-dihydrouridine synthase
MIGRGIYGKPWLFNKKYSNGGMPPLKKRLMILVEHTEVFEKYCDYKNFAVMRKHFKAYVEGFDGAKELRVELMEAQNAKEVKKIIKGWLKGNKV